MKNVIECLNIWIVPFALIRAVCLKLDEKKKKFDDHVLEWELRMIQKASSVSNGRKKT